MHRRSSTRRSRTCDGCCTQNGCRCCRTANVAEVQVLQSTRSKRQRALTAVQSTRRRKRAQQHQTSQFALRVPAWVTRSRQLGLVMSALRIFAEKIPRCRRRRWPIGSGVGGCIRCIKISPWRRGRCHPPKRSRCPPSASCTVPAERTSGRRRRSW